MLALEILAGGDRFALLETGEPRAIEGLVVLDHGLGEGIGVVEQVLGLAPNRLQAILGVALGRKRADLNHPAGALARRRLAASKGGDSIRTGGSNPDSGGGRAGRRRGRRHPGA